MLEQRNNWKNVLSRYVATITFLCDRGLSLRGSTEIIGSRENGNYLVILELIAQFDQFFVPAHLYSWQSGTQSHVLFIKNSM